MPGFPKSLKRFSKALTLLAALILPSLTVNAQEGQYDHGTPPQHAAGVSPLGSYTSADLGTINLTNGALNMKLPLGSVGGRGFSLPLTLNYSSKVWSASRDGSSFADETGYHPVGWAEYADIENLIDIYSRVAPGWTIGAVPTLIARGSGIGDNSSTCAGDFNYALTKLTVILPDKGEIQLRDDVSDGAPLPAQAVSFPGCFFDDGYRGLRWHATDGSGVVFISDPGADVTRGNLNGVLVTADGTRYRFSSSSGYGGSVDTIKNLARAASVTDRNGNLIAITYPNGNEVDYADQLGRVTKIQKNIADPQNPSVMLALLVTIPGYQGQTRYFKVKTAVMNQRFRSGISPTLPVINGDYDPLGWGLSWGTATRLFGGSHGTYAERIDMAVVLSECVLPDGRSLQFFYNEFGEVAEVQMPTGGKVQYDYQYVTNLPAGKSLPGEIATSHFASNVSDVERGVVARRTYPDGVTKDADWAYSYTVSTAQVTVTSAAGIILLNQKHYFLANGRNLYAGPGLGPGPDRGVDGSGYNLWSTGIERRTETLNAAGTAVIAASEQDWTQRTPIAWTGTNYGSYQTEKDNRINEERKILDDLKTARVAYLYDLFNNPTQTSEYDFDNTLKRRTTTSYSSTNLVNGTNYAADSIHLIRLPLQQSVYDGASVEQARTTYEYDIYTGDGNHDYMLSYASITGHDTANYGLTKTTRGNATRIGNWVKSSNSYLYAYPRYDLPGNVVSTKDANGNVATMSFTDDYGAGSNPGGGVQGSYGATYALPTLITSPPPIAGAPQQSARSQYDFSTGLLSGFKDRNGIITQTIYNDALDRPTQVKSALGITGVETHTAMYYAPATAYGLTLTKNDVLRVSDQTTLDDAVLRAWTRTDGFGRTTESWKRDPQGDVKVAAIYDGLGHASQTSNPFRPSLGETAIYTTNVYDLAGRVLTVTTPDSAVVTTGYISNAVTVTDQMGKSRRSITDGLSRLVRIDEPDATNNLGTVTAPTQATSYSYDALDDLTNVTQGTQPPRTFVYDSLKRLTSATNPESGTICYGTIISGQCQANGYDANGNLIYKTDARGVLATYTYDALNRNTLIDYSDATPDSYRQYDLAINGKGRINQIWQSGTNTSATYVDQYDVLGRPVIQRQRYETAGVWSASYQVQRTYDLAGHVRTQTYPSNRRVTYNYDQAGRLGDKDAQNLAFTGDLGDGVTRNYSSEILYSPLGGMTKEKFGTDTALYNKLFYNSRGQLAEIREGTSYTGPNDTGWERGAIINYYGDCWGMCGGSNSTTPMTNNNGNLKKQEIFVPGAISWLQQYDYDNLNRLQGVSESTGGTTLWRQEYVYDRYGNRTIHQTNTWGSGIPKPNFGVATASNRLTPPAGYTMSYDAAGNLSNDTYTGSGTRTYDAENRMTTAWGGNNQSQVYTYNPDGQRTRRKVDGVETWQVYGMDGELVAEYAASGAVGSPQKEYGYRNGQLLVTATRTNVALASNGGVASASSTYATGSYPASGAINGDRKGTNWGSGGGWNDAAPGNTFPDWLQVDFNGSKTVNEVDVFSVQDSYANPAEPTETMTFSLYGLRGFDVQYWTGSAWQTVTGGSISGNNLVWKKINFTAVTTSKIRVLTNASVDGFSRITEVEAWGGPSGSSATINWLVTDQLGTPRMIFDKTGALATTKRHDYLPFGEELPADPNLRTIARGYGGADGVRQKFTQKERDIETGLDYSLARYYSATQGRFTSVDPLIESAKPAQPQGWNRYSYAINNPLKYIDPSGLIWGTYTDNTGQDHYHWYKDQKELEASGATAVNVGSGHFIYEAGNGQYIRLNAAGPNPEASDAAGRNGWAAYDSFGGALEHQNGERGDTSTVADQAFGLALSDTGGRIVADVGARLLARVLARTALDFAGAAEMQVVRTIGQGERIADIVNEAKAFTFQTGNEHALVTLANGERALVSGGQGGINFGEGQITRLFGHTHGYQFPAGGASAADRAAIQALGQRSSWVLERGQLSKFGRQ